MIYNACSSALKKKFIKNILLKEIKYFNKTILAISKLSNKD